MTESLARHQAAFFDAWARVRPHVIGEVAVLQVVQQNMGDVWTRLNESLHDTLLAGIRLHRSGYPTEAAASYDAVLADHHRLPDHLLLRRAMHVELHGYAEVLVPATKDHAALRVSYAALCAAVGLDHLALSLAGEDEDGWPDDHDRRRALGMAAFGADRNELAMALLRPLLKSPHADAGLFQAWATLCGRRGDAGSALTLPDDAHPDVRRTADPWMAAAEFCVTVDRVDDALSILIRGCDVVAAGAPHRQLVAYRALLLVGLGRIGEARAAMATVADGTWEPAEALVRIAEANILLHEGRLLEAGRLFASVRDISRYLGYHLPATSLAVFDPTTGALASARALALQTPKPLSTILAWRRFHASGEVNEATLPTGFRDLPYPANGATEARAVSPFETVGVTAVAAPEETGLTPPSGMTGYDWKRLLHNNHSRGNRLRSYGVDGKEPRAYAERLETGGVTSVRVPGATLYRGMTYAADGTLVGSTNHFSDFVSFATPLDRYLQTGALTQTFPATRGRIEEACVFLPGFHPTYIGNILLDYVPRVLPLLDPAHPLHGLPVVYYTGFGWQTPLMEELGFPRDQLVPIAMEDCLTVREAHIFVEKTYMLAPSLLRAARPRFLDVMARHATGRPRHVYVTRRNSPRRSVVNDAYLIKRLESLGYECLDLEDLDYPAMMALLADSRVFLTTNGAALGNVSLLPDNVDIIDLCGPCYFDPTYWMAASVLDLRYHMLTTRTAFFQDHLYIDPDKVAERLKALDAIPAS